MVVPKEQQINIDQECEKFFNEYGKNPDLQQIKNITQLVRSQSRNEALANAKIMQCARCDSIAVGSEFTFESLFFPFSLFDIFFAVKFKSWFF